MAPERRAILLLLGLSVAGQGIRYLVTRPDHAPGDIQILGTSPSRSATTHAEAARNAHRQLAAGERIDADRANAQELARLPRVGLSLAKRIVVDRDSNGPFGGLEGLDRVPGIGPGMLKALEPYLAFSGAMTRGRIAPMTGQDARPTVDPSGASPAAPLPRLNVNTASVSELERLPLIGPSRALAIVEWRRRHGSFKNLDDLVQVPGVSRRMAEAIRHLVAF
jgi:competence protein ComEA